MMRSLRLGVPLILLLAAAACGAPQDNGGGSSGNATGNAIGTGPNDSVTSTELPPPSGPPPTQPNVAYPDTRAINLRPVSWTRAQPGQGQQLMIYYTVSGRGECSVLGRVNSTETDKTVTVTVFVGQLPGSNCTGGQPMLAASFLTTVTLRQPLGARPVADGAPAGSS